MRSSPFGSLRMLLRFLCTCFIILFLNYHSLISWSGGIKRERAMMSIYVSAPAPSEYKYTEFAGLRCPTSNSTRHNINQQMKACLNLIRFSEFVVVYFDLGIPCNQDLFCEFYLYAS